MTIKKPYLELHALLVANEDKKVKSILSEAIDMMSAKGAGGAASSIHRAEDGTILAIMDYYFKKWLLIEFVEFGAKANSASGLNTMCKLGTSLWTKQQREFKKGKEVLLEQVAAGDVLPTEIQANLDELEEARGFVANYPIPELAFTSTDDVDVANHDVMEKAVIDYNQAIEDAKDQDAVEAENE